jgi:hypothetical protein
MKRLTTLCLIAIGLMVSQVSVNAQQQSQATPQPPEASFPSIPLIPAPRADNTAPYVGRDTGPSREERVIRKGILAPHATDVAQYEFLLSQKKTGIMRLLPRERFDWEVYKAPKELSMRGGGTYFSFHYRSHEYGYGSDISYDKGNLKVGFTGGDYGMLLDIGVTPLEPIDASDPRAAFLLKYKPPKKKKDLKAEKEKIRPVHRFDGRTGIVEVMGLNVDGVVYRQLVPALVGHTYLLRSIVYNRSDVVVAFRIVSRNDDGGLTIAWKILKEFRPPYLS